MASANSNLGVAGPLGSLALSVVRSHSPNVGLRTLKWQQDLLRLGIDLPFFLCHDIGLLLACPNEQLNIAPRVTPSILGPETSKLLGDYVALITEIGASEAAQRSRQIRLSDDVMAVLLARLFSRT